MNRDDLFWKPALLTLIIGISSFAYYHSPYDILFNLFASFGSFWLAFLIRPIQSRDDQE